MYGFTHSLVLTRSSTDDNTLCTAAAAVKEGKVNSTNISWHLLRVTPSDVAKFSLLEQIKKKVTINCAFRMRQHIAVTPPEALFFT